MPRFSADQIAFANSLKGPLDRARAIEFLKGQEEKRIASGPAAEPEVVLDGDVRFSAKSVRSQRKRLGLSGHELGRLIGVTGQAVYNWENGTSRPREEQFAAFVAVRGMGKREARRRLERAWESLGAQASEVSDGDLVKVALRLRAA